MQCNVLERGYTGHVGISALIVLEDLGRYLLLAEAPGRPGSLLVTQGLSSCVNRLSVWSPW